MQRSFSIVDDDDPEDLDEQILKKYSGTRRNSQEFEKSMPELVQPLSLDHVSTPPSAGPSGRKTVLRSRPSRLSTDSDDSDEDKKNVVVGEYDPKEYENLDVTPEIKEVFQYITKYIPQPMSLDHKFRPFVPEFLPAVGDIDAFLKVVPPAKTVSGEEFTGNKDLGLVVLDEPAANQSDAALLHLQLRAESVKSTHDSDVVVKKVDNVEKNVKIIDKWIKDISALHKSKSFPAVRCTEDMPDLDELMQEWSEDMEKQMKEEGFPEPTGNLEDYVEEVCGILHIPVKNKIHSLHLFFSLYAAIKSSQLFKSTQIDKIEENDNQAVTDQLVLD